MGLRFSSFMRVRGSINYCNEIWNYADKVINELDQYEAVYRRLNCGVQNWTRSIQMRTIWRLHAASLGRLAAGSSNGLTST